MIESRPRGKSFFLARLRRRYARSKLSPAEFDRSLAEKVGCSPRTVQRALTEWRLPSLETLRKFDRASEDLVNRFEPKGRVVAYRQPTARHAHPYPLTLRGSKIVRRCRQLGLSQAMLARKLGQHRSAVTNWLYHRVPSGMVLENLARTLDVDPDYLVNDDRAAENSPESYEQSRTRRILEMESRIRKYEDLIFSKATSEFMGK